MRLTILLAAALGLLINPTVRGAEPDAAQVDEQTLKQAGVAPEGEALLKFFQERILTDQKREKIVALIAQLGDDSFEIREKATAELTGMGGSAVSLLRQALQARDTDVEVVRRAERCLAGSKAPGSDVIHAAARTLARCKADGAAGVLLAFLPFAENETTVDVIAAALVPLAVKDGNPDKTISATLQHKLPLMRGIAGEALARAGNAEQRRDVRTLLKDADPGVRLRVAVGLAEVKEKEAIPTVIALLTELPTDQAWRAEELLCRLAGEQMPAVALGADDAARKKCRDAWTDWWAKNGEKADLARLTDTQQLLGYTLVVQINPNNGQGHVYELGPDKKPRWQIANIPYPVDAQVIRQDRVLIAEYNGQRVTERDFNGKVLWQKQVPAPLACSRLPNGNTFIACHNQILIVDPAGKEVFNYPRPNHDIMTASRLRDGQIVFITNGGTAVRLDAKGKEVKTFATGYQHQFGGIDVLPNGRIVVPQINTGKVVEFDLDGKQQWTASVQNPTSAFRLPNGNTLTASFNTMNLIEVDKAGKVVWQHKSDGRPWKARRR